MRDALTVLLALSLVVHVICHAAIFVNLLRRRSYRRAALGLLCSPLAALFAWEAQMKPLARAWLGSLLAYALGVILAHVV
jgi:hypothetical protein